MALGLSSIVAVFAVSGASLVQRPVYDRPQPAFQGSPSMRILFLGGHLLESDGLLQVFGQHFHLHGRTTPQVGLPSRWPVSVKRASRLPLGADGCASFLAHFDDPFCKPFTSCHR